MNAHNLSLTEELIECCHNEINLEKVKSLVEKGAKLNYMGKKTPLHVIINAIIEKYEANPYKPIISPEHYPKHIKLFIWIIENGHKYIDRLDAYKDHIFFSIVNYGDYIMIQETLKYMDRIFVNYEDDCFWTPMDTVARNLIGKDKSDIIKLLSRNNAYIKPELKEFLMKRYNSLVKINLCL